MPIRPDQRWLYPIDWQQLSRHIRFERARGRCEQCGRPHLRHVEHLGDGIWWDADGGGWRNGNGASLTASPLQNGAGRLRRTYVVLACAHLDHNPANNRPGNLAALCQRCHMLHDREEHRYRRWYNAFVRRALRELFVQPMEQQLGGHDCGQAESAETDTPLPIFEIISKDRSITWQPVPAML